MTSGYDKRSRKGDPLPYSFVDQFGIKRCSGLSPRKSESVTSFRSHVVGQALNPRQVDLYGGFLNRKDSPAAYFNPGPRLLEQLETSGVSAESDYESLTGRGLDNGHPFEKVSQRVNTSLRQPVVFRPNGNGAPVTYKCIGAPTAVLSLPVSQGTDRMPFKFGGTTTELQNSFSLLQLPTPDSTKLKSDGVKFLTSLAPAAPKVSITAALAELALGLPQIPGLALRHLSYGNVGDEYLNTVFGIMPTYDDAMKIAETLRDVSVKLHQIRRDEGRRVRRRAKLPVTQKSEIYNSDSLGIARIYSGRPIDERIRWGDSTNYVSADSLVDGTVQNVLPHERQLFMSERRYVSFSGSFTYVLPEIPGFSGRLERYLVEMDSLVGLSVSARTAWQITPWSWLIDWFMDVRENIAAISVLRDDNHVVNYAYAMETVERQAVAKVTFTQGSPIIGANYVSTSVDAVFKRRIRANPYGFVTEQDSGAWGPYRLAILAALGISRA